MTNKLQIRLLHIFYIFVVCCLFSQSTLADDFPPVPKPFKYVVDYTNTLSPGNLNVLENKIITYSKMTSSQIAVVMLPSVGDYEIADYSFKLMDKWGIGQQKLDNGVLMLIAKDDHKIWIAVGQGLEDVLPDASLASIIRNEIVPYFKQNNYITGIQVGLDKIIELSQGKYKAKVDDGDDGDFWIIMFLFIVFVMFILAKFGGGGPGGPRRGNILDRVMSSSGLNSSSGFGGGRSSGGGGSSGGGFGGGRSGGGGAGGRW